MLGVRREGQRLTALTIPSQLSTLTLRLTTFIFFEQAGGVGKE